jgi:tetratricopeptide (TPR) repeat protein
MRVQQGNGPSSEDARLLAKRNDLDGALHLYSLVLQKNPNDQEALFGVGGIHFKRGEYRKASEAWLTLKALNPSYPRIEEWVAQVEKRLAPPPPPPVPRPSPEPPPQSPAVQPKTPPRVEVLQSYTAPLPVPDLSEMDGTEDEDWQRQAVRIDEINEDALKSPLPEPPPPDQREEPKAKKWEFQDEPLDEAPPRWTLSVGWIVVWVYAALVWRIYFY